MIDPSYAGSGLAIGVLVGLTGVGGGSLMTPLLILLFGFHPATAVGTDLLYAAATKTLGATVHGLRGMIEWRIVGRLAAGSVPGAAVTLLVLHHAGVHSTAGAHIMSLTLGAALLLTAVALLFRPWIMAYAARHWRGPSPRWEAGLTIATGLALGILVSLTSVGAGALGVTVLLLLYPRLTTARIVASDIAHAVPLTLVAGAGHWLLGSVDGALLGSLLAGSLPGVVIGSTVAGRIPDLALRPILAMTLLAAGGSLVW